MIRQALCVVALLALAGCTDWNEKAQHFATYQEFRLSPYAGKGFLPRNLVPVSAHDIRITVNMDSTEVQAEFDFDPQDEEGVSGPFMLSGKSPNAEHLLVRCGQSSLELLQIAEHAHAKYWTSWDPAVWTDHCSRPPAGTVKA